MKLDRISHPTTHFESTINIENLCFCSFLLQYIAIQTNLTQFILLPLLLSHLHSECMIYLVLDCCCFCMFLVLFALYICVLINHSENVFCGIRFLNCNFRARNQIELEEKIYLRCLFVAFSLSIARIGAMSGWLLYLKIHLYRWMLDHRT